MKVKDFGKTFIKNRKFKDFFSSPTKMMVLFCCIPLFGFLIFSGLGIETQSLGMVLLVGCPIAMIGYLIMMKTKNNECDQICSEEIDQFLEESIGIDYSSVKDENPRLNQVDLERLNRRKTIQKPLLYPRFTKRRSPIVTDFQPFLQN